MYVLSVLVQLPCYYTSIVYSVAIRRASATSMHAAHSVICVNRISGAKFRVWKRVRTERVIRSNLYCVISGQPLNDLLKAFFSLRSLRISSAVDAVDVCRRLVDLGVLPVESLSMLTEVVDPSEQGELLMTVLQSADHPQTFVRLRQLLAENIAYKWIVDDIDMALAAAVAGRCTSPSLLLTNVYSLFGNKKIE